MRHLKRAALFLGVLVLQGTVAISQTAPGTYSNPIKGGATLLQFSRVVTEGTMQQGTLTYYQCGTMETQQVLHRIVSAALVPTGCDEVPEWKGAALRGDWNQWIRVMAGPNAAKYQGIHAAQMSLMDPSTGAVIANLQFRGTNGVGTHRSPLTENCETCAQPMHFEGSFSGAVVSGVYKGSFLQGTYAGDWLADPVTSEQSQPFRLAIDGVVLKFCANRFTAAAPTTADVNKAFGM